MDTPPETPGRPEAEVQDDRFRLYQLYSVITRNDGPPLFYRHQLSRRAEINFQRFDPRWTWNEWPVPDGYLWVDFGEDGLKPMMDRPLLPIPADAPSIYVCSDAHYSTEAYAYRLGKAREATLTLCNQTAAQAKMRADGLQAGYLPHAVEPTAYPAEPLCDRKYDVCFVGHIGRRNRAEFLDTMFRAFPNFWYGSRFFEEAARIYRQTKIVLNQALDDDLNMRVFEVLATRSLLLTPMVTDLPRWFEDGKHLVTYRTTEEAVELARYYLAHEEDREQIAEAGYREVLARHTYAHRADVVVRTLRELRDRGCAGSAPGLEEVGHATVGE